jgi:phosphatidylglycerophosphate synthase
MPGHPPSYADILMRYTRRYNVALAIGLVTTAVVGWLAGSFVGESARYAAKAAAFFVVLTAAVVAVAGHQHPHPRVGAANVVTTIRASLAALVAGLIGYPASPAMLWWVVGVAVMFAALDGIDGWLARMTRMASGYGARFDMETDAAFILVLSILVWQHGKAGSWVLLCGLMRYAFVAAGHVLPWLAAPLRPTRRGRTVAVGQLLGLSVALAPPVPVPASDAVAAVTLAALTWSFAIDVAWLARQHRTS